MPPDSPDSWLTHSLSFPYYMLKEQIVSVGCVQRGWESATHWLRVGVCRMGLAIGDPDGECRMRPVFGRLRRLVGWMTLHL